MSIDVVKNKQAEAIFLEAERYEDKGDFEKAFQCLFKAAKMGHGWSKLNLGNFYANGTGVKKDLAMAAYWYKAAFRQGDVVAARNLAIDRAAAGNIRSAITWFRKGVDGGDGGSFIKLAQIYAGRRGGKPKAIELLRSVNGLPDTGASDLDREQAQELLKKLERA